MCFGKCEGGVSWATHRDVDEFSGRVEPHGYIKKFVDRDGFNVTADTGERRWFLKFVDRDGHQGHRGSG